MDCLKASVTSLIFLRVAVFNAQISRQIYLQINFQHEFSIMGRFGQSVQLGKQISNPLKYPFFEPFLCFHGQNSQNEWKKNIEASAQKKVHILKLKKWEFLHIQ